MEETDLESQLRSVNGEIQEIDEKIRQLGTKKQRLISQKESIQNQMKRLTSEMLSKQDWERTDHTWSKDMYETLRNIFKIHAFRSKQLSAINAVMSSRDCILLMPTGGGKSLCYQLPALIRKGITLVVSPLVSLMEDQVMAMEALGVPAMLLNASSTREKVNYVHQQMTSKEPTLRLLYVTPEKLAKSKRFVAKLEVMYKARNFSLLAIDEVHCCSQWGHDFRTDYKFLGIMKTQFPSTPILGLTATATSAIINDVQNILRIEESLIFKASFNRPNLKYEVCYKSSNKEENVNEIATMIKRRFKGLSGIVYCFSIKETETITVELQKHGVQAKPYHAELSPAIRSSVHASWTAGRTNVIVATVAFGMGIDKPDVRFVIHFTMPKSMENFYQESGRAGRDDKPSHCILFYRFADIFRQSPMVFQEKSGLQHLYGIVAYCLDLSRCRRSIIAEHFEERWETSDCNKMCDHCDRSETKSVKQKNIATEYSTLCKILEHCDAIEEPLTANKLIDIWLGKGAVKCRPKNYTPTGMGRETCERIIGLLVLESYLKEEFHFTPYSTISYIVKGPRTLPNDRELCFDFLCHKVGASKETGSTKKTVKENSRIGESSGLKTAPQKKILLGISKDTSKSSVNRSSSSDSDIVDDDCDTFSSRKKVLSKGSIAVVSISDSE